MKIRVRFCNEGNGWFIWDAISMDSWEAGDDFPPTLDDWEVKELTVELDYDEVQKLLNVPVVKGQISK